jgi:iron-sulfur cluster repair protein YtfE (RIC family)
MKSMIERLGARDGLPPHLRVLADKYPRDMWEDHPHFSQLTRFWLDRHLMFRRAHVQLVTTAETFLNGDADPHRTQAEIARMGQFLLEQLHGHHQIEDAHYFPIFAQFDKRLEEAFTLLDGDHHELDATLADFTQSANGALRALGGDGDAKLAMGGFHGSITTLGQFLDRHLMDEEEIIVPLVLEYAPEEFR